MTVLSTPKNSGINKRYKRARFFEQEAFRKTLALNATIFPKWFDNNNFIYERETKTGKEYRSVNPKSRSNRRAFDHQALAQALSRATKNQVNPIDLPINKVRMSVLSDVVSFDAFGKSWEYEQANNRCREKKSDPSQWLISPDGKKAIFCRDHNLWVIDLASRHEKSITLDGEENYAYGVLPQRVDLVSGLTQPAPPKSIQALWSPNSKKVMTIQTDERHVAPFPVNVYVPDDGSVRPKCLLPRYALPDDERPVEYRLVLLDIASNREIKHSCPRIADVDDFGPFQRRRLWWSSDSQIAYFVDLAPRKKSASVVALDTQSGTPRIVFGEEATTYIDLNFYFGGAASFLPLVDSDELIWWSERSGWAHIYLYDLKTGQLKRPITEGKWIVREVVGFDEIHRDVFIQIAGRVNGRDPYYREICRVNIDTGALVTIASGDHNYVLHKRGKENFFAMELFGRDVDDVCGISPCSRFLVVTRTRVDQIPISELYDRDGNIIMELERADVSGLPDGWQWPEPVELIAADGKTDIYGTIFRPSDFDPSKCYPVIDYVQGHSITISSPKGSFYSDTSSAFCYLPAVAWAELGFVVVTIDGRGTNYRDKDFRDHCYANVNLASDLADHITAIKQLGAVYPYMDLERVGITGPGGCNAPVYGLLAYPSFYKVAAAISIYDIRLTSALAFYQALPDQEYYKSSILGNLAGNLEGKLLLAHGMMDNYFHPAGMLQLIESFIRENKNFDMLLLPRGGHMWRSGYALRKAWDYMVLHLQGETPPDKFTLKAGVEFALEKLEER